MNRRQNKKSKPLKTPPTKEQLFNDLINARDAFDQAADDYIASQTPQNQLALTIALRNLSTAERSWQQWVYDNTP